MPKLVSVEDLRRRRRAEDARRCRQRRKRGAAVYPVEIDEGVFDLLEKFADLKADRMDDRQAVADALGKLLRLALAALLDRRP